MKTKHFLIITLVIGLMTIVPLAAADDTNILDAMGVKPVTQDTTVNIGGIDFVIPKGFGEETDLKKDNETIDLVGSKVSMHTHVYTNEKADLLSINVFSGEKANLTEELNGSDGEVEKTINNQKGYYSEEDGMAMFTFVKDNKMAQISAPKDIISTVVK